MRKFLPIAYLLTLLTGCATSNQVSSTARSSIEERLLISSFEQALARLDTQEFKGKSVTVDFYGLTADKDFAKEFFTAWLQGQQVQIATDPKQAQLEIALFKNASHSGHAEVEVFTIDGSTGKFVDKSPSAVGETNYNDYTVLIVVHFTRSDMETRKWDWQPGS